MVIARRPLIPKARDRRLVPRDSAADPPDSMGRIGADATGYYGPVYSGMLGVVYTDFKSNQFLYFFPFHLSTENSSQNQLQLHK